MPTISKQIRTELPRSVKRFNGVLGRAIDVADLPVNPIKILLYGGNRTGKTTLACQFPKPLLLVSFEPALSGGVESVRKVKGINYIRVVPNNSPLLTDKNKDQAGGHLIILDECMQLPLEIREQGGFKTVVFDGATSAQDVILANLLDLPSIPDQMSWGMVSPDQYRQRSEKVREVLRPFLDLPLDTVVLAKEKDHNPPKEERVNERTGKVSPDMRPGFVRGLQQQSYIAADLGGASVSWLQDACDCICRLYVEEEIREVKQDMGGGQSMTMHQPTGKYIRHLRTGYHPNYAAGIRSADPKQVPDVLTQPTYQKLEQLIRGTTPVPKP